MPRLYSFVCLAAAAVSLPALAARAEDEPAADPADRQIVLAEGAVSLEAPEGWLKKQPRVRIIDFEFEVPAVEGDPRAGRVTVMGAGGSIEANLDRWIGLFSQPDGGSTRERARIEKLTVAGTEVHVIDLTGTYKDQPGPFAPAAFYEDYRMLGAIVATEKQGHYFIKFYGPRRTVAQYEDAFTKMLEGLQVAPPAEAPPPE